MKGESGRHSFLVLHIPSQLTVDDLRQKLFVDIDGQIHQILAKSHETLLFQITDLINKQKALVKIQIGILTVFEGQ